MRASPARLSVTSMTTITAPEFKIPSPDHLGPDPEPVAPRFAILLDMERESRRSAVVLPLPAGGHRPDVADRHAA